jgi:hypothetical protein
MTEPEWLACGDPVLMRSRLGGAESRRKVRLFAAACCRELCRTAAPPPDYVARHVAQLSDALSIAEGYADGDVSADGLKPARAVAELMYDVYCDSTGVMNFAAIMACNATREGVDYDFDWLCEATELGGVPRRRQAELIRDLFGTTFRAVAFPPGWRTPTTRGVALRMYDSRDFSAVPILADALEDAGCDDADILAHCRGSGPHVRGCWVVDLVLGKE